MIVAGGLPHHAFAAYASNRNETRTTDNDENNTLRVHSFQLGGLDKHSVERMIPTDAPLTTTFGLRADEIAVKAFLKVRYTYSPMLTPVQSHIRVLLNGEIVSVLPITKEDAGRELVREIEIPAAILKSANQATLEFIGHYTNECEDPLHASMWVDILRGSEIRVSTRPTALKNDLALLPAPFFDPGDFTRVDLPFVFPAHPSSSTLQAAGIVSSWFGQLASWRSARFPAWLNVLPKSHAVVFATNGERPTFLRDLPPFDGPSLKIIDNPQVADGKLLLVTGRDGAELRAAATALVLNGSVLSGDHINIARARNDVPRQAYDAPNWVRLDRPMKFGELVQSPQQLQVFGHLPDPIRINMHIPPDLFTWRSRGVPVDLKLRYTPPVHTANSQLRMSINDEPVQVINLRASGQGGDSTHVVLPLLDSSLLGDGRELLIPAFKLGVRNRLEYFFSFAYHNAGSCRDTQVENVRAMIDPDSQIDFSGYPHYAQMPHLGYFSTAGFPFTKYADLAQTTVVMPRAPTPADIETMLTLLGRMGESTGYPATRVTVAGPDDSAAFKDRDLLVIGSSANQPLLDKWGDKLPAVIAGPERKIRKPVGPLDRMAAWLGMNIDPPADRIPQRHVRGNGPLAALLGMESPLTAERSVVVATAVESGDLPLLLDALDDDKTAKTMHGSVVLIHGGNVESLFAGKTYTIGSLPLWTSIWFPLSEYPILLAVMSVVAVLIFAFALWRTLRAVASRRLRDDT